MYIACASARTPVSYHTARVDDLDIFYREAGPSDAPVILLLHGLPSSSRMYQSLLESSLADTFHLVAPDYPGFGHSSWPDHLAFKYTFDHLAAVMQKFADQLHLDRYVLFMQDYGGPVGFRMALANPQRVQAMIIQNAVLHEEGLSALWEVRRAFWKDRLAHESNVRANLLSLEATRQRHVGTTPHPECLNPDTWVDEYYFLNRPGQSDIQLDLFYDYQSNLKSYPAWQQWLRDHQPPLLVLWGRYDPSFTVAGAEAYRREVPGAKIHILDAGHFALDLLPDEIVRLTDAFLKTEHIESAKK
ncbi:MAG: alpha/beta hydrolase fold family protein [Chthoniobacteraceae bacterium]|nr:alpha/beta hydrolase fold family protein [Chthoniobacteraceae bacterium]